MSGPMKCWFGRRQPSGLPSVVHEWFRKNGSYCHKSLLMYIKPRRLIIARFSMRKRSRDKYRKNCKELYPQVVFGLEHMFPSVGTYLTGKCSNKYGRCLYNGHWPLRPTAAFKGNSIEAVLTIRSSFPAPGVSKTAVNGRSMPSSV